MRSDEITVSRQGNLAVINHAQFEIKFNLSKGTWDYVDGNDDTIIRDGCTQITLDDGSVVKTEDAGTREFITELPKTDAFGTYHQIRFSHEATGKGVRINTYLNCYTAHPAIHLKVGIENLKSEPLRLDSVTVLGISSNRGGVLLGGLPADCHLFINTPPVSPGVSRKLYEGFLLNETDAMHPSNDGVLCDTKGGKAIVFGFLTTEKWWPRIQVGCHRNGGRGSRGQGKGSSASGVNPWALYHECRQQCNSGEEITSETAYVNFADEASAAYKHYTSLIAAQSIAYEDDRVQKQTPFEYSAPATVWTLFDTEGSIDANAILTQIDALAESPMFQPNCPGGIDTIQLNAVSESELEIFPRGSGTSVSQYREEMKRITRHIRAKGFKAGIRFNPFCAVLDSALVRNHPDYCIREQTTSRRGKKYSRSHSSRNGYKPASVHLPENGKEVALLDVSHPEVQSRIREQMKQIVGECGYSFIYADFTAYTMGLTNASHNMRWHDRSLTSLELYRLAGKLLREAIDEAQSESVLLKDDVLLAGYNTVPGSCIGSIDVNTPLLSPTLSTTGGASNRPSDAWHHQRGTKHRLSRYAAHLREHNVLWGHIFGEIAINEPRPINEAIVEMTAAALSGGTVLCADQFPTLTPLRAGYLAKIFPLIGKAATPVDLYDEPFPKIWYLPVSTPRESWHLAAVFNWDDTEDDAYFELETLGLPKSKEFLVHDFWMRQYLGKVSDSVTLLNIPPRSAKLLCFREEQDVPQFLATDMHYTQGGVEILSAGWDRHSQSYMIVCKPLRQAEGTCFIHVPDGYLPVSVATYGGDYQYNWDKPICKLTFTGTQPDQLVQASVHFAKTSGGNL
ncbi:alpha-galactosidase [Candidatus Poribacteria bacterium]|nr:alpha-galactosidase [Candidatus Poribacteria bacterium]